MKIRHELFTQKLKIRAGLQECPTSHKTRRAIRSGQTYPTHNHRIHAYTMKYRTISEQELPTSHPSLSTSILSNSPPKVPSPDDMHSISPSAYNCISHHHTVRTTNQLTLHPLCMRPCASINRRWCQP